MASITLKLNVRQSLQVPMTASKTLAQALNEFCAKFDLDPTEYNLIHNKKQVDLSLAFRLSGINNNATLELKRSAPSSSGGTRQLTNSTLDTSFFRFFTAQASLFYPEIHHQLTFLSSPLPFVAIAEAAVAQVQVALTLENGRHIMSFPSNISIWNLLQAAETEKKLVLTTNSVKVKPKKGDAVEVYNQPIVNFMTTDLATNTDLRKTTLATLGIKSGSAVLRVRFKATEVPIKEFLAADAAMAETEAEASKATEQRISDAKDAAKAKLEQEQQARKEAEERRLASAASASSSAPPTQQQVASPPPTSSQPMEVDNSSSSSDPQPASAPVSAATSSEPAPPTERKKFEIVVEPPGPPGMLSQILADGGMLNEDHSRLHELLRKQEEAEMERFQKMPSEPCPRDVRVFAPSNRPFDPSSIELPADFFDVSANDLAKERQLKQKNASANDTEMKTKALKERERLNKLSKFKKCFIRFRFPDRIEIQAAFYPQEGLDHLTSFVASQLVDPDLKFYLFTTPPITNVHASKNLRDQGFLPAALVHVGLLPGVKASSPFLKQEALALIEENTFNPVVREYTSGAITPSTTDANTAPSASESKNATSSSSSKMDVDDDKERDSSSKKSYQSTSSGSGSSSEKKTPKWFTAGLRKK